MSQFDILVAFQWIGVEASSIIKSLEFPRYGIYSFMTSCDFLQNTIRLSRLLYWLKILSYWDLQQTESIEKLIQFFTVLSKKKQLVVSRKQSVVFLQHVDKLWFLSLDWERFKTDVIAHLKKKIKHESVIKNIDKNKEGLILLWRSYSFDFWKSLDWYTPLIEFQS